MVGYASSTYLVATFDAVRVVAARTRENPVADVLWHDHTDRTAAALQDGLSASTQRDALVLIFLLRLLVQRFQ